MSLEARAVVRVGSFDLDVEVHAPAGSVTAVLGPNGSGKTTFLRTVAGTLPLDDGEVVLGDVTLDRPPTVFVPPERRRLGIVHQDGVLFPHLDALDNVAFGPRAAGRSRREARARAAALLDSMGLAPRSHLRPGELSGGQRQRVALARALAVDPAALLLDEPLAALDATVAPEVRRELRRRLADVAGPTVLVTHDPVDVLALADRVTVVESGRVTQAGTLAEVTTNPRSRYVADLIGVNLLRGSVRGDLLATERGLDVHLAEPVAGPAFATIAPSAVAVHRREPEGSPRNRWPATVSRLDVLGDRVRVHLAPPVELVAEITPAALAELTLREGDDVWVSVKATEVRAYPA